MMTAEPDSALQFALRARCSARFERRPGLHVVPGESTPYVGSASRFR